MMPFFLVQNKKINSYCPDKKTAKINTTAPLQVRKCCRLLHEKGELVNSMYIRKADFLKEDLHAYDNDIGYGDI